MLPKDWNWYVCNQCGFRVCPHCQGKHTGPHSTGGFKCSQCPTGYLEMKSQ